MKILISIPCSETIAPETFKSIYGLQRCGNETLFNFVRGYDVANARNRIVKEAVEGRYDYVLMVDSDIVLPSDTLRLMLENPVDVCSGVYMNRHTGRTILSRKYDVDGTEYYDFTKDAEYTVDEVKRMLANGSTKIKVHGTGGGCLLIKTEVIEKLPKPLFKWVDYDDGHGTLSEDLYFCTLCKKAGIDIHADLRVDCGHIFRNVQNVI